MKYKTLTYAVAMSAGLLTTPLALADLNDGLVAYYPFNGNANDESGNGNEGTVNGATLTEDKLGNADSAYSFDGINDYISVADGSQFNFTNNLSLSLWVKPQSTQVAYAGLIDKNHYGPHKGFVLQQSGNRHNSFYFGYGDGTKWSNPHGDTFRVEFNSESWNHLVISKEDTEISYFLNGVHVITENVAVPEIASNEELPLYIGSVNGTTRFFNGIIDDIRIYNRALSEDEIQALYAGVPEDGDCQHATYSLKKRTLTVPFVEMPVVDFLTGQPTGEMELWTGSLRQVFGTTNRFRLINKTVAQITDGSSSSCPATYAVDTGTLKIPYIDVPTGIAVGNQKFENNVEVFKATMTWEPMGKSFVVQEVEMLP